MRTYKPAYGPEVDLDNPSTYDYIVLETYNQLNDRMLRCIGYAICYMDYWHPDIFGKSKKKEDLIEHNNQTYDVANCGYNQRKRVEVLIKNFTTHRRQNWENLLWFKEQIFLFEDEIENMC